MAIFLMTFAGLWLGIHSFTIPGAISISMAAASPKALSFMLTGIGFLLPVILVYSGHMCLVFRGKLREGEGYGISGEGYE